MIVQRVDSLRLGRFGSKEVHTHLEMVQLDYLNYLELCRYVSIST